MTVFGIPVPNLGQIEIGLNIACNIFLAGVVVFALIHEGRQFIKRRFGRA